jgi:hypothetical protein
VPRHLRRIQCRVWRLLASGGPSLRHHPSDSASDLHP